MQTYWREEKSWDFHTYEPDMHDSYQIVYCKILLITLLSFSSVTLKVLRSDGEVQESSELLSTIVTEDTWHISSTEPK